MANHSDSTLWTDFLQDTTIMTPVLTNVSPAHIENDVAPNSMKHHIEKYCFPVICVFGLLGNTLAMIVFLRKQLRTTSCNLYLAA
ncbi:hypothetical protein CHS0354_027263, partial [Potamilus streckersoni]